MITPKETLFIQSLLPTSIAESASLHLDALLFSGPNHWVVWVNGHKIGAATEVPSLTIETVSAHEIQGIWQSKRGVHSFRLGINQTFFPPS